MGGKLKIKRFKEKITNVEIRDKKFLGLFPACELRLMSENIELSYLVRRKDRERVIPLKEAFDSGKDVEIEGKMTHSYPFKEFYRGKINIGGSHAYTFIHGSIMTFPRTVIEQLYMRA